MECREHLQVPVIGVAWSDWTIEQLRGRARASVEKRGDFDEAVLAKLQERLVARGVARLPLVDDGRIHRVRIELGSAEDPPVNIGGHLKKSAK